MTPTQKTLDEIRRLADIVNQLPKTEDGERQWVRVVELLTQYVEITRPAIEAHEHLNQKWQEAALALESFLTALIEVKEKQNADS